MSEMGPKLDVANAKSPLAIVKYCLFLFSLLGFAVLAGWECGFGFGRQATYENIDNGEFMMAMLVIAWLISIFYILAIVFWWHLCLKIPFFWWIELSVSACWALLTFVASCVYADDINVDSPCDMDGLRFAAAMGFFTFFALVVDAILCALQIRADRKGSGGEASAEPAPPAAETA